MVYGVNITIVFMGVIKQLITGGRHIFAPALSSLRCQVHSLRDGRRLRRPRRGNQVGWEMAGILTEQADS